MANNNLELNRIELQYLQEAVRMLRDTKYMYETPEQHEERLLVTGALLYKAHTAKTELYEEHLE
jgi:hypothetical protein